MRKLSAVLVAGAVGLALVGLAVAGLNRNYNLHLSGEFENPVRVTDAHGVATFQLSKDGTELRYKLNVARIDNVFMAHIHCGGPADNGSITVWLFPSTAPVQGPQGAGAFQGRIADGTITAADVIAVEPSATCPGGIASFSDLIAKLNSGGAYVNVHTSDGVAPANTGPGDFPGGEIRANF